MAKIEKIGPIYTGFSFCGGTDLKLPPPGHDSGELPGYSTAASYST